MPISVFRTLFGKPPQSPPAAVDPEELAARIHALVIAPRPRFSPEEEALGATEVVAETRAGLAINLLRLRAMKDPAALSALHAFIRIAFGARDRDTAADSAIWQKNHAIAQAGDATLAQRVRAAIDAEGLSRDMEAAMDAMLGVTEAPTEATFDESAYLAANPDVAAAVARGDAASGLSHWRRHGAAEGRVQRRLGAPKGASSLVFPLRFCRDEASSSGVGEIIPGARGSLYAIAPLTQAEAHDASPSFAAPSQDHASPAFDDLLANRAWTAPPLYVAAFGNACADLRNGALIFDRDKAWGDSFYATILSPGGHARAPEIFSVGGQYAWRRRSDAEEELFSDTPLMLCTTWASRVNYGHWLMNTLFSVYLVLDKIEARRMKLLCPPLTERQRNEIVTLGAPAEAIVETGATFVTAEQLLYPSPLSTYANMKPPARVGPFLDFVRTRFETHDGPDAPEYVFLSRAGFPSARRMTNEGALCDALRRIGFHIARTHELTLGEQIRLMSKAKVAVGQFGAAMWNTPFMPRGAQVVEIATSNYVSNEYLYVSHLTGHRLHRVLIEASSANGSAYDGEHFEFAAPVDEIVALARSLM